MTLLQRDIITSVLKTFSIAVSVVLLLMTLGGAVKEGMREGLPLHVSLQAMPLLIPEMLRFALPGCLLFAVCSVFGKRAANNEILALKSSGINPLRVAWPVLILAYLLSIVTYSLYDACAAWSRPNLSRLLIRSIDEIALRFLESNQSFRRGDISIVVKGMRDGTLLSPVITWLGSGEHSSLTLVAESAKLAFDEETGNLDFECHNGRLEFEDDAEVIFPDRLVHSIPLVEQQVEAEECRSPAELRSSAVQRQIAFEMRRIAEAESSGGAAGGEPSTANLEYHRQRLYRLQAEVSRRLSNGFACLGFVLIGLPVAVWTRSADNMSVFFLCFGPILITYYPLLIIGEMIARGGFLPGIVVWLADAVMFAVGLLLLFHLNCR